MLHGEMLVFIIKRREPDDGKPEATFAAGCHGVLIDNRGNGHSRRWWGRNGGVGHMQGLCGRRCGIMWGRRSVHEGGGLAGARRQAQGEAARVDA